MGGPGSGHGYASEAVRRRGMADAGGVRRTRGNRNAAGKYLHIAMTGNRGAVGGATSLI